MRAFNLKTCSKEVPKAGFKRAVFCLSFIASLGFSWNAYAKCASIEGTGNINIIGNSFPALQHISKAMESCQRPGLSIAFKMTPEARQETERAFGSGGKSAFDAAFVSMSTYSTLRSKGQLQPITDLVKKYQARYNIEERMLVKFNGEVMAIAFMQNAQNLFYRKDIFDKHGLSVPTTYAEMIATAAIIKAKEPSIDFPIAQTFAKGWDSGTEFANLMVSTGGRFFKAGTAEPVFNDASGERAIEVMKSMLPYMTPNAIASNSDDVMNQFQQGKAAMGVLWASRAARMDDPSASKVVGKMAFAAAPSMTAGGKTATHLWWDGVVMPNNIAGDRDAVFQVLMEALGEQTTRSGNDTAIWIRSAYKPTRFAGGVLTSINAGAPVWPTEPFFSLAHSEIGKVLPDALTGRFSARAALDSAAAAYKRVATEKGFIPSSNAAPNVVPTQAPVPAVKVSP
jgi:multiple sugar transport system substrate-binding protein